VVGRGGAVFGDAEVVGVAVFEECCDLFAERSGAVVTVARNPAAEDAGGGAVGLDDDGAWCAADAVAVGDVEGFCV